MWHRIFWAAAVLVMVPGLAWAAPPDKSPRVNPADALSLLGNTSVDAMSGSIRGYLARNIDPTLFEASPGWGEMKLVARGVEWKGKGLKAHPELSYSHKNHGSWRHILVRADNLPDSLIFDIRDVQTEPGRVLFRVFASFDARIQYHQQTWHKGVKLYDGETRARLRIKAWLGCEATGRLEPNGTLLPDAVVRLRVLESLVDYDNFKTEHIAGVGGEAAEVLGDAVRGGLKKWDPNLERELLGKVEAAIVKSGDTKEVRLSVGMLLKKK